MRLEDQRESENVADRHGGGLSIGRGGIGLGGRVLALVVSYFLGVHLAFYRDLKERFKAPGEFAQAYVVAHELGHHVQNLLGMRSASRRRAGAIRHLQSQSALAPCRT